MYFSLHYILFRAIDIHLNCSNKFKLMFGGITMGNGYDLTYKQLIEAVKKEFFRLGYSSRTIKRYQTVWNRLDYFMKSNNIGRYDTKVGLDFLDDTYDITVYKQLEGENKARARAITVINDFYLHGMILPRSKKSHSPEILLTYHNDILEKFKEHRKKFQITESTLKSYDKYIGKFLFYLEKHGVYDLSNITPTVVWGYCNVFASYSTSTTHNSLSSLRVFLRFLYDKQILKVDLSNKVPHVTYRRDSHIPFAFPKSNVKKILETVDRGNPIGKRDYAILLLASELGLRSGDIRNLKFSSLHWEKNTIELTMGKTGKDIILPLLENIGMAIIDYLKYGRPHSDLDIVFLRHISPIQPLSPTGITKIVSRYIYKSGIDVKHGQRKGPHSLRHSLASALLEENVPLPLISEVLGHSDSRTTEIYLKIDIKQLRNCALEVSAFDWYIDKEVF